MFKKGDIIKGKENQSVDYWITNSKMEKAKVTRIVDENLMEIEIIKHYFSELNKDRYVVYNREEDFELIDRKK